MCPCADDVYPLIESLLTPEGQKQAQQIAAASQAFSSKFTSMQAKVKPHCQSPLGPPTCLLAWHSGPSARGLHAVLEAELLTGAC